MRELDLPHMSCFSHTLQLATGEALGDEPISKPIARCKKLVGWFRRSVLAHDALMRLQKQAGQQPLNVVQDVETRWNSTQPLCISKAKRTISGALIRQFQMGKENVQVLAASSLNPQIRARPFSDEQKGLVTAHFTEKMAAIDGTQVKSGKDCENEDDDVSFFIGEMFPCVVDDSPEAEIEMYLTEALCKTPALAWWRMNQAQYPRLAKIVRDLLCVPATSTPSERIVSVAGNTVVPKRVSLDSSTVDELVFLNSALSIKGKLNIGPNVAYTAEPAATVVSRLNRKLKLW